MEKIRKLRKTIGMPQGQLAEKLVLNKANYSRIEKGFYEPKNIDELKDKAIRLMHPVLISKIIYDRDELEKLESFSLQFKL